MISGAEGSAGAMFDQRALRATLAWRVTVFVLCVAAVILAWHPRRAIDLHVYLTAAERFFAGEDLYRVADGPMPFKYAPPSAWFFLPLASLPARAAAVAWDLGVVAMFAWAARKIVSRLERSPPAASSWAAWASVGAVLVLAHSLYLELHYAQVDVAMLAALVAGYVLGETRRGGAELAAGALVAVAVLLKVPAVVALVLPLLRGQWRILGGFTLALAVLWAPFIARYGWTATVEQTRAWMDLTATSTAPWITGHNPQGLPTLFLSWFTPPGAEPTRAAMSIAQLVALAVTAALTVLAYVRARSTAPLLPFAVGCAGVVLASPLAWRANFVLLLPLVLFSLVEGSRAARTAAVSFGVVGALVNPLWFGGDAFIEVMSYRPFTWAALALVGCALVAAPRRTPQQSGGSS